MYFPSHNSSILDIVAQVDRLNRSDKGMTYKPSRQNNTNVLTTLLWAWARIPACSQTFQQQNAHYPPLKPKRSITPTLHAHRSSHHPPANHTECSPPCLAQTVKHHRPQEGDETPTNHKPYPHNCLPIKHRTRSTDRPSSNPRALTSERVLPRNKRLHQARQAGSYLV